MSCAVSVHFPKPRHQGLRESSAYESGGALPTGKYDHVIVQPYYSRLSNDIEYGGRFFNQAVTYNPDVQFYVYAIWPKLDAADPAGETAAFLRQCEQTADGIMQRYPGHRPIRIIPVGSALLAVRNQIAAGGIPGLTSMGSVYDHLPETGEQDYGHLGDYGKYLGALVHFICIYHMHPGDLTNDIFSEWNNEVRTIPKEIADAFKEIAWTTVTGYPRSGVSDAAFSLVTTSLPNAYVSRQ